MCVCVCVVSRLSYVQLFATLWTATCQAPLFMGFSRPDYWSGLPWLSSRYLPDPGIEPVSLASPELAGRFFTTNFTCEALNIIQESKSCQGGDRPSGSLLRVREFYKRQKFDLLFCLMGHRIDF